ncbi:CHASE2 domain-containing protein [Floridanema aerugineum]|jgi:diguanylate cyclase (GGDEF)-like protein/PAS domain S-box-containing protein|uniref:CHASE2 domain-containing protein n=1 Tax=Floridaenema aerugineum BLCC-F46 TaxID=3153654 RepID=A0ABV4WYV3_9CYAN
MIKQLGISGKRLGRKVKQQLLKDQRVWISVSIVAAGLISLRLMGLLQFGEWEAFDQFFRLRPPQLVDERILIVGIEEGDIQRLGSWPIPDRNMAELIEKISSLQPRAIGLDIYRDLPVQPGHTEWLKAAQTTTNLVGIEQLGNKNSPGVAAPPVLQQEERVGFNNVVIDPDGKVRRNLLYWHINNKPRTSFALKLAFRYLQAEGIKSQSAKDGSGYLQLGKARFDRFQPNDGGYVRADAGGYQILANFQGPAGSFRTVSMAQMLSGEVPPEWVRDRIVLIGSTAESLKDFFFFPYSTGLFISGAKPISGVELQANFISQILNASQGKTVLFQVLPESLEALWIFLWSWLGGIVIWRSNSVKLSIVLIFFATFALFIISYLAFLAGWWLPFFPPMLGLLGSATIITALVAHLKEELKRSKEFLQNLIDAIPDPIFVKDKEHRWIVLNQAYSKFLGYPLEILLEKSDFDFFPNHEAYNFWQQDELVFQSGDATENEEQFTNSQGITHHIATKRSLHKDPAGNIFLVGIIRDITERKQLEEHLKRTADELARYNTELKVSEDRLRYLAYHDTLTGLPNRKLFYERLSQSIEWASQNHHLVALLFLDLDGFKLINDTKGHDIGDLLLQTVAERLKRCLRSSDTVSRLGGDEFTVILPGIPSLNDIARVADKILTTINQPFVLQGHKIYISTSIGISVYPLNGEDIETLIKNADAAMYSAKELGKNNYNFF